MSYPKNSPQLDKLAELIFYVGLPLFVNYLLEEYLIKEMKNAGYRGIAQIFLWMSSVYMRVANLGCAFLPSALIEANYRMVNANMRHENVLQELYMSALMFQFFASNTNPRWCPFFSNEFMQLAANMTTAIFAMGMAYTLFCPLNKPANKRAKGLNPKRDPREFFEGSVRLVLGRFPIQPQPH